MKKLLLILMLIVSNALCFANASTEQLGPQEVAEASKEEIKGECQAQSGLTPIELAGRGCCSHHGGQCSCVGGSVKCCDGSFSPSCSCNVNDPITVVN